MRTVSVSFVLSPFHVPVSPIQYILSPFHVFRVSVSVVSFPHFSVSDPVFVVLCKI